MRYQSLMINIVIQFKKPAFFLKPTTYSKKYEVMLGTLRRSSGLW